MVVDYGSQFKGKQKLVGGDWDGLRVALLREGCAERQIVEALSTLETHRTATIIADTSGDFRDGTRHESQRTLTAEAAQAARLA